MGVINRVIRTECEGASMLRAIKKTTKVLVRITACVASASEIGMTRDAAQSSRLQWDDSANDKLCVSNRTTTDCTKFHMQLLFEMVACMEFHFVRQT